MQAIYFYVLFGLIISIGYCQDLGDALACLADYISTFQPKMNQKLFSIFRESYPNTLSTTVTKFDLTPGNESTYIITGDIEAMWLRDSTNQFLPYMKITKQCPKIRQLARGLINTQAELIMLDSYTNAFKRFQEANKQRHFYLNDRTQTLFFGVPIDLSRNRQFATKQIWERKFQIDSLASFLRLTYQYSKRYKSLDFVNLRFIKALKRILRTIEEQIKDGSYERKQGLNYYTFFRNGQQLRQGKIVYSYQTGMLKTGFRPSDDANDLPFNIPGNAMFSTFLGLVAEQILAEIPQNSVFKSQASILQLKLRKYAKSIKQAIFNFGVVEYNKVKIFAYEVNGNGQHKIFDDANLPSLLSLPYLKFVEMNNEIYQNTRSYLLSPANNYFFTNGQIKGIGSSHTPNGNIWPLALITQILTTNKVQEIKNCLESLKAHSFDNLNHESFSVHNPTKITRSWFAWANSFFGQMIITLSETHPDVLK